MSDQSKLGIGQIITSEQFKDAIHVAVAPVEAAFDLYPGQHISLNVEGKATPGELRESIGVVDPFLKHKVTTGERFWLFLYPGSITSLRHDWSHPAFQDATGAIVGNLEGKQKAEQWLRFYAERINTYQDPETAFQSLILGLARKEFYTHGTDCHALYDVEQKEELEKYASEYLGYPIKLDGSWEFSCSC